jgi:transposase-like protein
VAGRNRANFGAWLRIKDCWRVNKTTYTKPEMPKRNTRRNHTPRFKFRVALGAAKGLRSINEIAAEHKLTPSQVTARKKELLSEGSALFEQKNARNRESEAEQERTEALERTLGRVVVEKEFLIKSARSWDRIMRKAMVEADHSQRCIRKQCELLGVNRNRLESKPQTDGQPRRSTKRCWR